MTLICIVPRPHGWAIEFPEEGREFRVTRRKYDAVEEALEIARSNPPSKVRILAPDGSLEDEHSFERPQPAPDSPGTVARQGKEGEAWATARAGDRESFDQAAGPHLGDLETAARQEIACLIAVGDLDKDAVTADELVEQTLAQAWRGRQRKPDHLGLKAWLIALLYRGADRLAAEAAMAGAHVSTAQPAAEGCPDAETPDAWHRPDDAERGADMPVEAQQTPDEILKALGGRPTVLTALGRRAVMLNDVHRIALSETAAIIGCSLHDARELLAQARAEIRKSQATAGRQPSAR